MQLNVGNGYGRSAVPGFVIQKCWAHRNIAANSPNMTESSQASPRNGHNRSLHWRITSFRCYRLVGAILDRPPKENNHTFRLAATDFAQAKSAGDRGSPLRLLFRHTQRGRDHTLPLFVLFMGQISWYFIATADRWSKHPCRKVSCHYMQSSQGVQSPFVDRAKVLPRPLTILHPVIPLRYPRKNEKEEIP